MIRTLLAVALLCVAAAAALAQEAPRIGVRFGMHPEYERMVFDWPQNTRYRVSEEGGRTTIVFERGGDIDQAALARGLARLAQNVTVAREGERVTLSMTLNEGVRLRHSTNGPKVVIDLTRGTPQQAQRPAPTPPQAPAAAPPAPAAPPASATPPAPGAPPASGTPGAPGVTQLIVPPEDQPAPAPPTQSQAPAFPPSAPPNAGAITPPPRQPPAPQARGRQPQQARPAPAPPAAAPPPPAAPVAPAVPAEVPSPPAVAAAPPTPAAPPLQALPPQALPPQALPPQAPAQAAAPPPPAAPAPGPATAPAPPVPPAAAVAPAPDPAPSPPPAVAPQPLRVEAVRAGESMALRFAWPEPVAAAVFERGGWLWIVFDRAQALDLSQVMARRHDVFGEIELIAAEPAAGSSTILRLSPPTGAAAAARREGNVWVVELLRAERPPPLPADVAVRPSETRGVRLWVELPGAAQALTVRDPEVGDELVIVPTPLSGAGVSPPRIYPQVRLPATVQGAVVSRLADGVEVRTLGAGIDISAAGGLLLSPGQSEQQAAARAPGRGALLDFDAWRRRGPPQFEADRQALQQAIAAAGTPQRNAARMDLARFLFAHGFVMDAVGVLRLVEQEEPALLETPEMRAMRGVAALLTGDTGEAARQLRHVSLAGQPEAVLWRVALALEEGSPRAAVAELGQTRDVSEFYPPPFANRLGLWVVEARIAAEAYQQAEDRLAQIVAGNPSATERARADYLRGLLLLARERREEAARIWQDLENGPVSPTRVMATLARVEVMLQDRRLAPADAVAVLERLRFAWRGDALEFRVLTRLGRLLLETRDYRGGLAKLREAASLFPTHPEAAAVIEEMRMGFVRFWTAGDSERMPPVSAIAMFEDFRDLLPQDQRGEQIVRQVVDRLIGVDLLDRAAGLLDAQLHFRAAGPERADTGAKLAFVRLLDRKPQQALEALAASAAPGLSAELQQERRRLEARALADLGRPEEGLARLDGDTDREADLLRAEIMLRSQEYEPAVTVLERIAGDAPAGPMPSEQARQVLHLTVAAVLSGNDGAVRRARARYTNAMQATPFKDIFNVLTSTRGGPPEDMRAIAARVQATAPFQSFMTAYRERFAREARAGS